MTYYKIVLCTYKNQEYAVIVYEGDCVKVNLYKQFGVNVDND